MRRAKGFPASDDPNSPARPSGSGLAPPVQPEAKPKAKAGQPGNADGKARVARSANGGARVARSANGNAQVARSANGGARVAGALAAPVTEVGKVGQMLLQSWLLLLVADKPSHGYQLLEALRGLGVRLGNSGYVYRMLRTMEESGVLSSYWQGSVGGPPHRIYRLTALGRATLDHCAAGVASLDSQLQDYLTRYRSNQGDDGSTAPVAELLTRPARSDRKSALPLK